MVRWCGGGGGCSVVVVVVLHQGTVDWNKGVSALRSTVWCLCSQD